MRYLEDPGQKKLFDIFEGILSPVAYRKLQNSWQHLFRCAILNRLPAVKLAEHFDPEMGRPTKELYSMARLLFVMELRNWTHEEAADAYMYNMDLQYALNLQPEDQSLCRRTIERYIPEQLRGHTHYMTNDSRIVKLSRGFDTVCLEVASQMAKLARTEVFAPDEVAIVHVTNRVVRRCFLFGEDLVSGKNFDHRKVWIENELKTNAAYFGIDLLGFAILSNHFHLILRSRPDCVAKWDDTEVARRWLMLCPIRKDCEGQAEETNEFEKKKGDTA